MKLIKYLLIIFFAFPNFIFSQSNMKDANLYITKLDNEKK